MKVLGKNKPLRFLKKIRKVRDKSFDFNSVSLLQVKLLLTIPKYLLILMV